jgi:hypothetical protein
MKPLLLLLVTATSAAFAQPYTGQISGRVIDGSTQETLAGANIVVVEQPRNGAATDPDGNFLIDRIDIGEYSLRVTLLGYESVVITNVVVSTGRSAKVSIKMREVVIEGEGIEVRADYFRRAGTLSPVSTTGLDAAEVRRSPGSAQDMQRIVQNLPGVGNSNDQSNELIVRGGAPNENLTVMDYIEIPTTNHFPNQFNSGGPINMVNVDLIEDIQFSTGGFPAQYGDKLSSVMNVTIREGDRRRLLAGHTAMHFAGFSGVFEGGIGDGDGSWIVSVRQSFITAIPKYWDAQVKAVYDLSSQDKLILSGIYGNDRIFIVGENKEEVQELAGVTDSLDVDDIRYKSEQYAAGLSWKRVWGSSGYSVVTLSTLGNVYDVDVQSEFRERSFASSGRLAAERTLHARRTFLNLSNDSHVSLKLEALTNLSPRHQILFGGQAQTLRFYKNDVRWEPDTTRLDLDEDGTFEIPLVTFPGGMIANDLSFGDATRYYAFVSDKVRLSPRWTATAGIRYDYFDYSKRGNISPRFSTSYNLLPPTTSLSLSYGEFYQTQTYPVYSDNRNIGYNRSLRSSHARHLVLGLEHILDTGLKANLEAYYKQYSDLPVSEQFIYSADKSFRSDLQLSVGKRQSYGFEFLLQQKQVGDLYGTLSYSYSRTTETDPRLPPQSASFTSMYDYPHIVTAVLGKRIRGVRSGADDLPLLLRIPTYLVPLSDDMEISFRFRYQSGNPYTPRAFVTNEQRRIGGVTWSRGVWVDDGRVNSARYPAYHRLDLQWISRYAFSGYNIEVVFLIENVYNRANVFQQNYRSDGTVEKVYQFSFFPVVGIALEF